MGNVCCKCLKYNSDRVAPIESGKDCKEETTARKRLKNMDDSILEGINKDEKHVKFDSPNSRQNFNLDTPNIKPKLNRGNYSEVFADKTDRND